MGVLTESMMRLRGEIGTWRHGRVALHDALVRATGQRRARVSALRAAFARDRAGAHRAWLGGTPSEPRAAEMRQQKQVEGSKAMARRQPPPTATLTSRPSERHPAKLVSPPAAPPPAATVAQKPKPPRKKSKKR